MSDTVFMPPTPGVAVDNTDATVTDDVVVLLEANENRKSALILNVGDASMRVTTDGSDPTPTHGKPVGAGNYISLTSPYCPVDEVKAIREGDTDTVANASEVN